MGCTPRTRPNPVGGAPAIPPVDRCSWTSRAPGRVTPGPGRPAGSGRRSASSRRPRRPRRSVRRRPARGPGPRASRPTRDPGAGIDVLGGPPPAQRRAVPQPRSPAHHRDPVHLRPPPAASVRPMSPSSRHPDHRSRRGGKVHPPRPGQRIPNRGGVRAVVPTNHPQPALSPTGAPTLSRARGRHLPQSGRRAPAPRAGDAAPDPAGHPRQHEEGSSTIPRAHRASTAGPDRSATSLSRYHLPASASTSRSRGKSPPPPSTAPGRAERGSSCPARARSDRATPVGPGSSSSPARAVTPGRVGPSRALGRVKWRQTGEEVSSCWVDRSA